MGRVYHPKERLNYLPEDVSAALAHVRRGENESVTTIQVEGGNVTRNSTGLSTVTINSGIVSTTSGGLQVVDNVTTTNSEVGLGRTEIVASLGQEKENIAGGGIENPVNNTSKSRLKVTIKFPFHGCCTDCKFAGDDCPLVWGECTHCFHLHCIMKWLQTQQQCPMCRQHCPHQFYFIF